MKRLLYALILLPQLLFAQYNADCFTLNLQRGVTEIPFHYSLERDSVIPISIDKPISGLSISGSALLDNDNDSHVRIVLKDDYNYEHLVYESFPLLNDGLGTEFSNTAIETIILDGIVPHNIRVELHHATLKLTSIQYVPMSESVKRNVKNSAVIQKAQCQFIANRLNENLQRRNMTWWAGVTPISERNYEEKKTMFGGKLPQLYGYEYYKGGIFVIPESMDSASKRAQKRTMATNQYVKEWDWRNRHGRNWMTPARYQGDCGSCWAFAVLGALEARVNLYFNQTINYELSAEELISCISSANSCSGGFTQAGLSYAKNNGIVKDSCFHYVQAALDCSNKCQNPEETISIEDYDGYIGNDTINFKKELFKAPMTASIPYWNHAVTLAGYKEIQIGDSIYNGNAYGGYWFPLVINSSNHPELIGKTAWLIKNSWSEEWGDQGFAYVVCNNIREGRYMTGKVYSQVYSDSDIICVDSDGDGYYYWGIGEKPSHCPEWVPDTPDGDDSNINNGPIDDYGNIAPLSPNGITINSSVTYNSNISLSNRIGIVENGVLTISATTVMTDDAKIRVCENGTLIVDGGTIQNANIELIPGCHVIVRKNGIINMASGVSFNAPQGAVVDVEYGSIN